MIAMLLIDALAFVRHAHGGGVCRRRWSIRICRCRSRSPAIKFDGHRGARARRSRRPRRRSARMPRRLSRGAKKLGAAKDIAAARTAFGERQRRAAWPTPRRPRASFGAGRAAGVLPDGEQAVAAEGQGDQEPVLRRRDAHVRIVQEVDERRGPRVRATAIAYCVLRVRAARIATIPSSGPGHQQQRRPAPARRPPPRAAAARSSPSSAGTPDRSAASAPCRRDRRGEYSLTSAENCAESATTAKPQTITSTKNQIGGPPKTTAVSAAQPALVHIAQIATRARPSRSASQPASAQPAVPLPIARNAASDPAAAGVGDARRGEAGRGEHGNPRPHRVELPHVSEVAERREPRAANRGRSGGSRADRTARWRRRTAHRARPRAPARRRRPRAPTPAASARATRAP